jgi:hypothetical protein
MVPRPANPMRTRSRSITDNTFRRPPAPRSIIPPRPPKPSSERGTQARLTGSARHHQYRQRAHNGGPPHPPRLPSSVPTKRRDRVSKPDMRQRGLQVHRPWRVSRLRMRPRSSGPTSIPPSNLDLNRPSSGHGPRRSSQEPSHMDLLPCIRAPMRFPCRLRRLLPP